ncbi:hypothetical protein E2C01_041641 [Portunus trituberculatus]|uniref:Uncharacterized protein n=1 Tax=Portunus trituberculatus TaxID=210409 RepID=A0A5B7FJS6_PORTR|nr:hypothetical protein [Portunus trituberculatus]
MGDTQQHIAQREYVRFMNVDDDSDNKFSSTEVFPNPARSGKVCGKSRHTR